MSTRIRPSVRMGSEDVRVNNILLARLAERTQTPFEEFCEETTLDGWYYISKRNIHIGKKFFWASVILGSISLALFFVHTSLTGFINTFVMISIGDISYPLNDVIFPSIVVCNNDPVSRSFIREMNLTSDEVGTILSS